MNFMVYEFDFRYCYPTLWVIIEPGELGRQIRQLKPAAVRRVM